MAERRYDRERRYGESDTDRYGESDRYRKSQAGAPQDQRYDASEGTPPEEQKREQGLPEDRDEITGDARNEQGGDEIHPSLRSTGLHTGKEEEEVYEGPLDDDVKDPYIYEEKKSGYNEPKETDDIPDKVPLEHREKRTP